MCVFVHACVCVCVCMRVCVCVYMSKSGRSNEGKHGHINHLLENVVQGCRKSGNEM